jgi:hypothetical protein
MSKPEIVKFDYKGQPVTFEYVEGHRMVNATEMARPFKKLPGNFLRLKSTKEFVLALDKRYSDVNNGPVEALRVIQGGDSEFQGTWMSEHLALRFAGWLEPMFEVWVYERILELITTGKTELQGTSSNGVAYSLRMIADSIEQQGQVNEEFREDIADAKNRLTDVESQLVNSPQDYTSITGFCKIHGVDAPQGQAMAWGKEAVKLSKELGAATGKAKDPRWGHVRTYRDDVLMKVILGKGKK